MLCARDEGPETCVFLDWHSVDDILLRGGVREEHHVEITGECGSGKTQLCMQVSPFPPPGAQWLRSRGTPRC